MAVIHPELHVADQDSSLVLLADICSHQAAPNWPLVVRLCVARNMRLPQVMSGASFDCALFNIQRRNSFSSGALSENWKSYAATRGVQEHEADVRQPDVR